MAELRGRSQPAYSVAGDPWRSVLAHIPTLFGRLAYLAQMRDAETGRYSHPSISRALGPEDADQALRQRHHQVFGKWLALSLEEQKSELEQFLAEPGGLRGPLHYRELPPPGAREVERQLYFTDVETLLELLDAGRDGAWGNPEA